MDDSELLHPNLLRNEQLIAVIRERQLDINNLEKLSRNELMELFKKHIMPKPQRQRKGCNSQSQEVASTNNLANDVKRIKLTHQHPVQQIDRRDCNLKRNIDDQQSNKHKRQRIQWP